MRVILLLGNNLTEHEILGLTKTFLIAWVIFLYAWGDLFIEWTEKGVSLCTILK